MASLLHYGTYKYVVLKDRKLGVGYYLLVGCILLYTVVEIFVRKGYMEVLELLAKDQRCYTRGS